VTPHEDHAALAVQLPLLSYLVANASGNGKTHAVIGHVSKDSNSCLLIVKAKFLLDPLLVFDKTKYCQGSSFGGYTSSAATESSGQHMTIRAANQFQKVRQESTANWAI
jgi:hypothetical protein